MGFNSDFKGLTSTSFSHAVVAGRCQAEPVNVQQPQIQQPSIYAKPEAASAVLGS